MEILLSTVLPIILYVLGAILLVVLIILGIKLIQSVDRANRLMDDIQKKSSSLDGLFHMIDRTTDTISVITDRFVESAVGLITRLFHSNKKKEDDYE